MQSGLKHSNMDDTREQLRCSRAGSQDPRKVNSAKPETLNPEASPTPAPKTQEPREPNTP